METLIQARDLELGKPIIYLIDDHAGIRRSMQWMLESRGFHVHTSESAEQFLREFDDTSLSCILVDYNLGSGMNGLELQQRLRADNVKQPIFFISDCSTVPTAVQAIREGAVDFIVKPIDDGIFSRLQHSLDRFAHQLKISNQQTTLRSKWCKLTPREREVVGLAASSRTSRAIARDLELSPKTVDTYRTSAMKKLGARSLVELARIYWNLFPSDNI